jgi:asparagine synthase (glutamine-hydrolysing)
MGVVLLSGYQGQSFGLILLGNRMCGISVYIGSDPSKKGRRFVERANRIMAHRGPNDEGIFVDHQVVLGHRRLSIVDLSATGHQPMVSPDRRWVLVYNGELYNHISLRERLCKGWCFQGHSDTETVLALLSFLGPNALKEMVGMWALMLWDRMEQRLLVSRDRYGQKPLYWRHATDGSLRLASEISPLLEPGENPKVYPVAIGEFLSTGNYGHFGERTFFRDIFSFPPAHWAYITLDNRTITPHRYWRFPVLPLRERRPLDQQCCTQFRTALEEAVTSQLMSDVPVGATLSGGLDSSAVVGILASQDQGGPIPVFTAQTSNSRFDESRYVRAVSEKWGNRIEIHWTPLKRMRLSSIIYEAIRVQEEPFGDPSIVAHGCLMDAARAAGVPVILGGQGADEMLFGYIFMIQALISSGLRNGQLGWATRELGKLHPPINDSGRIILSAWFPPLEKYLRNRSRMARRYWLSQGLKELPGTGMLEMAALSSIGEIWLEAIERVALPHLTHYDDRNGMARSVEGRMPFLDHRLAEVITRLEPKDFLFGGQSKFILRQACCDLLPPSVLQRRDKIGFFTPIHDMIRSEISWINGLLTDDYARSLDFYELEPLRRDLTLYANGKRNNDASRRIFRALTIRVWAEVFDISPSI